MDKTYVTLFTELAHATEVLSEKVLEVNKKKNDERGINAAETMRRDYAGLYDQMRAKDFDPSTLGRKEYAKFLVGAIIMAQQLDRQITTLKTSLQGYKIDVIPKLERIVNETKTDEESQALASELFQIKEKSDEEEKSET